MAATPYDNDGTVRTAGGVRERGTANQRHLVREVEQIDGVNVFASFTWMGVDVAVRETAAFGPLVDACERHGFELTVEKTMESGSAKVLLTADDDR